ncbi:thioredoxin domain-containing protein [bacterium]|nr:thioredoxin domain-containing protein [bacterium]
MSEIPQRLWRFAAAGLTLLGLCLPCAAQEESVSHTRQPLPGAEEIAKLPPDGGPEFNRLVFESSPYLRQHARNPVDWYAWGDEAFARARAEDKPVFLSVGYSTCHWCHVMEAECFEQADVAAILNANYICIKVDREERPDIDSLYMGATQMLLGSGGWPNNVWLLPDGRPFHAATYLPKEDDPYLGPGFKTVLNQLSGLYRTHRADVEADAEEIAAALRAFNSKISAPTPQLPGPEVVKTTLSLVAGQADNSYGGFGSAPKFPQHGHLALIGYQLHAGRSDEQLRKIYIQTLSAMANGGLRDHLDGGFHRYSTDAQWVLPHFEKMLYDNAQLARAYTDGWLISGDEYYAEVARDTCDWLLSDMQSPEGGFYSAFDADSEGEEGKFYVWSKAEILQVLGPEEGEVFCQVYGVQEGGNFKDEATGQKTGSNVLLLVRSWDKAADALKTEPAALKKRMDAAREKLLAVRDKRHPPELDDKVLTDWNGLTIGALAYSGRMLLEPKYVEAAGKAAEFVLARLENEGRLQHSYREGKAAIDGYLEDYTYLADGLLELYMSTGELKWLEESRLLAQQLEEHFLDTAEGGYFSTPNDGEQLLARRKPYLDDVIPAGNGMAARLFTRLANLSGEPHYRELAAGVLGTFSGQFRATPTATESLQLALLMHHDRAVSPGAMGEPILVKSNAGNTTTAAPVPDAVSYAKPVKVEAFMSSFEAGARTPKLLLRLSIDEGFHINAPEISGAELVATSLKLLDNPAVELGELRWPKALEKSYGGQPEKLATYEGADNWAVAELKLKEGVKPGKLRLSFELTAQACDDKACQLPVAHLLVLPLEVLPVDSELKPAPRHAMLFSKHSGRSPGAVGGLLRYVWAVLFFVVVYLVIKKVFARPRPTASA